MAEFDDRWRRLVAAARNAGEPGLELSSSHIDQLASLARHRSIAQQNLLPRVHARTERRSLIALAALFACVFFALLPCSAELGLLLESASSDLAQLPSRVPRPPHPPSAAVVLEALPDLHSFLELTPFSMESQP